MEFVEQPHTAIITGRTNCGKTHYVLDLLIAGSYKNHFANVVVIAPTFLKNKTYTDRYMKTFGLAMSARHTNFYWWDDVSGKLDEVLIRLKRIFAGQSTSTLFIIDDMASDAGIVQKRNALSNLAMSGRHDGISLWVLTQKYNSVGKDVRAQSAWICAFYSKDEDSFKNMVKENKVGIDMAEVKLIEEAQMTNPYLKLILRTTHPVGWTTQL